MGLCVYETYSQNCDNHSNALIHLLTIFDQSIVITTKDLLCLSVFTNSPLTETECSTEALPCLISIFGLGSLNYPVYEVNRQQV